MAREARNPQALYCWRFIDEQTTLREGWTNTGCTFSNGQLVLNGSAYLTSKVTIPNAIYSVRVKCTLLQRTAGTYYVFDFKGTNNDGIGTLSYHGTNGTVGSSFGTVYVNGSTTYTSVLGKSVEIVVSGTALKSGTGTYSNFIGVLHTLANNMLGSIELIEIYAGTLDVNQISNLYSNSRYTSFQPHGEILRNLTLPTWVVNTGTPTINGQEIILPNDGVGSSAKAVAYVSTTKYYKITCTVTGFTGTSNIVLPYDGTTSVSAGKATADGVYSYYYTSASTTLIILSRSTNGGVVTVNSIQEVVSCATPILSVDAFDGVIKNRANSTAITNTAVTVVRDGAIWAMRFNGTTSNLDCGTYNSLITDITICAWIKTGSTYGGSARGRIIDNTKTYVALENSSSSKTIRCTSNASTLINVAENVVFPSVYSFVVITRKLDGKATAYVNSVMSGTLDQNSGTPSSGSNILIGNNSVLNRGFDGNIATVKVLQGIISQQEISQIFTSEKSRYGL